MINIAKKIRARETPFWDTLYRILKSARRTNIPRIRFLGMLLSFLSNAMSIVIRWIRTQYVNQIMGYKCTDIGEKVRWGSETPLIEGEGRIVLGDFVSVGDYQTWVLGMKIYDDPELIVGNHTTINYRTLISVAQSVRIGNHVTLAGELKIFDNNSHSVDYKRRLKKLPVELLPTDVAPVVIEDHVWVGTQTIIMKGVTIGRGSVIASGSVVTKSIPPNCIAGGNPAKVLKEITSDVD